MWWWSGCSPFIPEAHRWEEVGGDGVSCAVRRVGGLWGTPRLGVGLGMGSYVPGAWELAPSARKGSSG